MGRHSGYCLIHKQEASKERLGKSRARKVTVGFVLLVVIGGAYAGLNALGASKNQRGNLVWQWNDKVGLLATVVFSLVFVVIGVVITSRQTAMSNALANAEIEERIRRMQVASILSLKAASNCGVEVVHAGLTVLPTFDLAVHKHQVRFLDSLTECYGSLALNAFPRNRHQPLVEREQLRMATEELSTELKGLAGEDLSTALKGLAGGELFTALKRLAARRANKHLRTRIHEVAEFLKACLELNRWYETPGAEPLTISVATLRNLYSQELQSYCCWDDSTVKSALDATTQSESDGTDGVVAIVRRCSLREASSFLSPWYLSKNPREKPPQVTARDGQQQSHTSGRERQDHGRLSRTGHDSPGGSPGVCYEVDYSGYLRAETSELPAGLANSTLTRCPMTRSADSHSSAPKGLDGWEWSSEGVQPEMSPS